MIEASKDDYGARRLSLNSSRRSGGAVHLIFNFGPRIITCNFPFSFSHTHRGPAAAHKLQGADARGPDRGRRDVAKGRVRQNGTIMCRLPYTRTGHVWRDLMFFFSTARPNDDVNVEKISSPSHSRTAGRRLLTTVSGHFDRGQNQLPKIRYDSSITLTPCELN
ncbi:hypothetical protein EVAR_26878_1 [Eumeta japonica]|uniref:Uncharacterized protein n=1 Tax=Eumeta variegata TaxID=151549 RepID=A0A4C1VX75_EUMVA|nr:hypothetical protein EVAR_26878_1 [Eumeta japonica]